jgi:ribosomal protein S18 acetylase RimI-like enzyme
MQPEFSLASTWSSTQLCDLLNACFTGYTVPVSFSEPVFTRRFSAEGVCLADSGVWLSRGEPVAVGLVARRGWGARLAAFAVAEPWRGKGVARPCLNKLFGSIREQGARTLCLEVLVNNVPAIRLYQSLGFQITQRLVGFAAPQGNGLSGESLLSETCDPRQLLAAVCAEGLADLPWMLAPETLCGLPCQAWVLGHCTAVVSELGGVPQLRFIYTAPEFRRQGEACAMLSALAMHYPHLTSAVSVPEHFSALFLRAGYRLLPVIQYEMSTH